MTDSRYIVSIHCMTYNHAPLIEDAMNGFCIQQTDFPYVAIIIDDASTDGEPEVIKSYLNAHFMMESARLWETDDARFIEAQHKENANCTFAVVLLKYNFWQAKKDKRPLMKEWMDAKYFAFCEGDDCWIHPMKLQMQVDALNKHLDCSLSGTGFIKKYINEKKEEDKTIYDNQTEIIIFDIDSWDRLYISQTLTLMCRHEAYDFYLKNRSRYESPKDTHITYHLFKQGKCAYIPLCMGIYNYNNRGIWSSLLLTQQIEASFFAYRDLYFKNNRDDKVYMHYFYNLQRYLGCRGRRITDFELLKEGVLFSRNWVDRIRLIRVYLAYKKNEIFRKLSID